MAATIDPGGVVLAMLDMLIERGGEDADDTIQATEAKDATGHEHADDGKFTSSGGSAGGATDKDAPKETRRGYASPPGRAEVMASVLGAAHDTVAAAKDAAYRVGKGVWDKLPAKAQESLSATFAAAKAVEHKLMSGFSKGREMAVAVAKERGMSDSHADKVGRIVAVADQVLAWTVNFPVAAAATGSMTAAKVSSFMPVASLAFVATSTATNPLATIRAARKVLKRKSKAVHESASGEFYDADALARLTHRLHEVGGDEWYLALVYAAMDESDTLADAMNAADKAYADHATQPDDGDEGDMLEGVASGLPIASVEQKQDYTCGPAAILAVAKIRGIDATEERISQLCKTTSEDGTPPINMLLAAQSLGLKASIRSGMSIGELSQSIDTGEHVIVCMQAMDEPPDGDAGGHWVVITGASADGVVLHDPAIGRERLLLADEFVTRWHDVESDGTRHVRLGVIVEAPPVVVRESRESQADYIGAIADELLLTVAERERLYGQFARRNP